MGNLGNGRMSVWGEERGQRLEEGRIERQETRFQIPIGTQNDRLGVLEGPVVRLGN